MSGPDVRWEGIPHQQIVFWVACGRGAKVTEVLEERLTTAAEALAQTADLANATLQRVNAGEWTGSAATLAAQAMQVARDFDDVMGHHGKMGSLAAFGQSDNADWAKSSVPPVASVVSPAPTGSLIDMVNATRDYHEQLQAAKDAEEQARRVMRDYESMTSDRVAAMPPLSPPPRLVAADAADTIVVGPDGRDDLVRGDDAPRPGGAPAADQPDGGRSGPGATGPSAGTAVTPQGVSGRGDSVAGGTGTVPGGDRGSGSGIGLLPADDRRGSGGSDQRGFGGFVGDRRGPAGSVGGDRRGVGDGDRRGSGGLGGARIVAGGGRGASAGAHGLAPLAAGRGPVDEERDHRVKYGLAGSEIFEPDHDDGLLHDPYRPGSFVAPATIGDDEDE